MEYDSDKVDDATLALMSLGIHGDREIPRAWKGFDWGVLDRLHARGYISDPQSKARSVVLSPEGIERARALFKELFGRD